MLLTKTEQLIYALLSERQQVTELRVSPEVYEKMKHEWQRESGHYDLEMEYIACDIPVAVVQAPGQVLEVR